MNIVMFKKSLYEFLFKKLPFPKFDPNNHSFYWKISEEKYITSTNNKFIFGDKFSSESRTVFLWKDLFPKNWDWFSMRYKNNFWIRSSKIRNLMKVFVL